MKSLQVLAALRHRDGGLNVLDKARKWWCEADDKGGNSAPVSAVFAVTIDALKVVEVRYADTTTADDVIIYDQDRGHWTKEDSITSQERNELLS